MSKHLYYIAYPRGFANEYNLYRVGPDGVSMSDVPVGAQRITYREAMRMLHDKGDAVTKIYGHNFGF